MEATKERIQALSLELSARQDIESVAGALADRLSASDNPIELEIDSLAREWLKILHDRAPVVKASVWANDAPDRQPRLVAGLPSNDDIRSRVDAAFRQKSSSRWPVRPDPRGDTGGCNAFLYFAEGPRFGIAVLATSQIGQGADSIVQFATRYVATRLVEQLAPGAHMRGYRDMAARMAELAGMSVLQARLELGAVREELKARATDTEPIQRGIATALRRLDDAHDAFRRAQLFGTDWRSIEPEGPIDLCGVIAEVARDIPDFISPEGVQRVAGASEPWLLEASKERLFYAFRDLIVTLWVLGEQKTRVTLGFEAADARVTLSGGHSEALDEYKGRDVSRLLTAPDQFLRGNDPYSVVRTLGIQTAIHLIAECGGKVSSPVDADGRLSFVIDLKKPTRKAAAR